MAAIELYDKEDEALGARDYYNHTLQRRAVVANFPEDLDRVIDFGGGPLARIFQQNINPGAWMLVVEDSP